MRISRSSTSQRCCGGHLSAVNLLIQRIDSCFQVVSTKFWVNHLNVAAEKRPGNIFPISYCPVLLSLCELWHPLSVLSWQGWRAACGLLLFVCSRCCACRDALLHTSIITSGCLSFCSVYTSLCPLTSVINMDFHPENCCWLTHIFSFSL